MARIQLALNVSDLDAAVDFYSKLFGAQPAKRRRGYANFAIEDPPLKLVLIERDGGGTLNHLGVEVESGAEVEAAESRLTSEGLTTTGVADTTCCYAQKTETWVSDPDGAPWEVYVKTADADHPAPGADPELPAGECCSPAQLSEAVRLGSSPASSCC